MSFDFRLRISGLHAIVGRPIDGDRTRLGSVELIAPGSSCHVEHVPRLVLPAAHANGSGTDASPLRQSRLVVTPAGEKISVLDVPGRVIRVELEGAGYPAAAIAATFDETGAEVPVDGEAEKQLTWVPPAEELGITDIPLPADEWELPAGANARFGLQGGGALQASRIVKDDQDDPIRWSFSPTSLTLRAIADELLFVADGVDLVRLRFSENGDDFITITAGGLPSGSQIAATYSHDVARIRGQQLSVGISGTTLEHLRLLEAVAQGTVRVPTPEGQHSDLRTGEPICPATLKVGGP